MGDTVYSLKREIEILKIEIQNIKADIFQINREMEVECPHYCDMWVEKEDGLFCSCGKKI